MHVIDATIFLVYMIAMLGVGFFFHKRNSHSEDFFVGGRTMGSWHIGLSVVATDVGGGFSIGLGGLGFVMGLSGSWMLFTGLIGAWLAAVFLIPVVRGNPLFAKFSTFPQLFEFFYNKKVAVAAGIISAIGYAGFTSSQVLAGAKLAGTTFDAITIDQALWIMGGLAVIYTVLGGLKAVIYTDTIQWIILMGGLIFLGIPMAWLAVGGWPTIQATLEPEMLSLSNISAQQLINWGFTIIPIWFVGMTLYQRIFASRDVKSAKKAWFLAGLFEWPIMAFMGVALGMLAKVAAVQGVLPGMSGITDAETGLPMLLKVILPAGLMGLMMSAYFSAILSTADSCLMAASANIVMDLILPFSKKVRSEKNILRLSQLITLSVGVIAILIAATMTEVLSLMLYSYAFMVSGLLVPVLGAFFGKKGSSAGALTAMIGGGCTTVLIIITGFRFPESLDFLNGYDANIFGLSVALVAYVVVSKLFPDTQKIKT